jgi:hypothetical protein
MVEPSPPGWAPRRLTQTPHGDAAQDVVRVWVGPHRRTQDLRAVGPGRIIHIQCLRSDHRVFVTALLSRPEGDNVIHSRIGAPS